jgi:hypothetical protein
VKYPLSISKSSGDSTYAYHITENHSLVIPLKNSDVELQQQITIICLCKLEISATFKSGRGGVGHGLVNFVVGPLFHQSANVSVLLSPIVTTGISELSPFLCWD